MTLGEGGEGRGGGFFGVCDAVCVWLLEGVTPCVWVIGVCDAVCVGYWSV